jgi:hypothetical protein
VKISLCLVLTAFVLAVVSGAPRAQQLDLDALDALTKQFEFVIKYGSLEQGKLKILYADNSNHVHIYRYEDGRFDLDWEQTNLGTKVTSMFVTELYGDGRPMLVITNLGGRILVYDMDGYDLEWENLQDPFETIQYMTSANIDIDPQEEMVFVAADQLIIYDSLNRTFEWVSQQKVMAQHIKLANMDDDPQLEIILNTGIIFDSKFYNIEFEADRPFGERITLFDINPCYNGRAIPPLTKFGYSGLTHFEIRSTDFSSDRVVQRCIEGRILQYGENFIQVAGYDSGMHAVVGVGDRRNCSGRNNSVQSQWIGLVAKQSGNVPGNDRRRRRQAHGRLVRYRNRRYRLADRQPGHTAGRTLGLLVGDVLYVRQHTRR